MRQVIVGTLLLLFLNCSPNPETYIEHINGYWEIEKVILADGRHREYNFNKTIDFISINDSLTGFRKKVNPSFNGTFQTSQDIENVKAIIENDSLHLYYSTPFSEWKETVLTASEDKLTVINSAKAIYTYKRYQPVSRGRSHPILKRCSHVTVKVEAAVAPKPKKVAPKKTAATKKAVKKPTEPKKS